MKLIENIHVLPVLLHFQLVSIYVLFDKINESCFYKRIAQKIITRELDPFIPPAHLREMVIQSLKTDGIFDSMISTKDWSKFESYILGRTKQMIHELLRKYDSDKTGLPDYALETSGKFLLIIKNKFGP